MKKVVYIVIFLIVLQSSSFAKNFGDGKHPPVKDTIQTLVDPEDETINNILKSRELPKKEKIQYDSLTPASSRVLPVTSSRPGLARQLASIDVNRRAGD